MSDRWEITPIDPEKAPRRPVATLQESGVVWIDEDADIHALRRALSDAIRLVHQMRKAGGR